ncbi:hypothetical protein MTO96_014506 [Rhipicephalus appendiculatus]
MRSTPRRNVSGRPTWTAYGVYTRVAPIRDRGFQPEEESRVFSVDRRSAVCIEQIKEEWMHVLASARAAVCRSSTTDQSRSAASGRCARAVCVALTQPGLVRLPRIRQPPDGL